MQGLAYTFRKAQDWPRLHDSFAQLGLGPLVEYFPGGIYGGVACNITGHSGLGPVSAEAGLSQAESGQSVAMHYGVSGVGYGEAGQSGTGPCLDEVGLIQADEGQVVAKLSTVGLNETGAGD